MKVIPATDMAPGGGVLDDPPASLLEALRIFFIGLTVSLLTSKARRSMLIHPSRIRADHREVAQWAAETKNNWLTTLKLAFKDPDRAELVDDLRAAYSELEKTDKKLPEFDVVLEKLPRALRNTMIVEFNTNGRPKTPEIKWRDAEGWILVGGQAVDRGFTVDSLTVTYMPRGVGSGTGRTVPIRLAGIEATFAMPCIVTQVDRPGRTERLTAITCLSRDQAVEAYFASIIGMLIKVLGPSPETTAVSGAVDHLIVLFQKLRLPPRKSIVGLVGVLSVISAASDLGVAVDAWHRDPDERYDFAVGNLRLEAKATSTRNRNHEMSFEQATPPDGTVGLLASMFVERSGGGTTLQDLLSSIESRLPSHEAILRLRTIVADTLGHDLVTSLGWSFDLQHGVASAELFDLRTIPAIRGPLPAEVSGVRFTTNLSGARRVGTRILAGVAAESRGLLPG